MRKELADELRSLYPEIVGDKSFACGDGWFGILSAMLATISNYLRMQREQREWATANHDAWLVSQKRWGLSTELPPEIQPFVLMQVKEKFGTLRVYAQGGDMYCSGVIGMATSLSERTCSVCGHGGQIRLGGWVQVLCDEHAEDKEPR